MARKYHMFPEEHMFFDRYHIDPDDTYSQLNHEGKSLIYVDVSDFDALDGDGDMWHVGFFRSDLSIFEVTNGFFARDDYTDIIIELARNEAERYKAEGYHPERLTWDDRLANEED